MRNFPARRRFRCARRHHHHGQASSPPSHQRGPTCHDHSIGIEQSSISRPATGASQSPADLRDALYRLALRQRRQGPKIRQFGRSRPAVRVQDRPAPGHAAGRRRATMKSAASAPHHPADLGYGARGAGASSAKRTLILTSNCSASKARQPASTRARHDHDMEVFGSQALLCRFCRHIPRGSP